MGGETAQGPATHPVTEPSETGHQTDGDEGDGLDFIAQQLWEFTCFPDQEVGEAHGR